MAEIRPFRGVRYNQMRIKDIASVICPPYDIITPEMQQALYQRHEFNFVRLEDNRGHSQDTDIENRFTRAAGFLEKWLNDGIFQADEVPAIYLHDHYFSHLGREYRRRGMTVVVRLEEWDRMVVRPHEGTLSRPKSERLNLLWALQANTSPILALFHDAEGKVAPLLANESLRKPLFDFTADGERHELHAIQDNEAIQQVSAALAGQPIYIADGHHRYESALTYRHERVACAPQVTGREPYNYVMMTLVGFDDPGLVILPAHRMVGGLSPAALERLPEKLKTFFEIEEVPLDRSNIRGQVDALLAEEGDKVKFLMFGVPRSNLFVLRLRNAAAAAEMMPYFHSDFYKRLAVSVLDHVVLEKLLGVGGDEDSGLVDYLSDAVDAVNRVLEREYQLVFLLNPVRAGAIKDIADAGDRMPRKSTYFYPKLPSGLVFYRHGQA